MLLDNPIHPPQFGSSAVILLRSDRHPIELGSEDAGFFRDRLEAVSYLLSVDTDGDAGLDVIGQGVLFYRLLRV